MDAADTSHSDITSITEDREGNIWVGTEGGGLDRLRNRVLELHGSAAGLPFETARSVCEDDAGTIWATGANGALVRRVQDNGKPCRKETAGSARGRRAWRVIAPAASGSEHIAAGWSIGRMGHSRHTRAATDLAATTSALCSWTAERIYGSVWRQPIVCSDCAGREFVTFLNPSGSRTIRTIVEDAAGSNLAWHFGRIFTPRARRSIGG